MSVIDDKYAELGGAAGFLGPAVTPEWQTPNGLGNYRHYQNGSIYHKASLPFACEVHGLIRQKWADLGWENSFLGFPLTDESDVIGAAGRTNSFEGGVIDHAVYRIAMGNSAAFQASHANARALKT